MFAQRLFNLVSHLIFSHWSHGYEEHHGACEDAYAAWLGPLRLEVNRCFVLNHDDASMSVSIPTPMGVLRLGYRVCLGEDEIRRAGCYWQPARPKTRPARPTLPMGDDFPF